MGRLVVFAADLRALVKPDHGEGTVRWANGAEDAGPGFRPYMVCTEAGAETRTVVIDVEGRIVARSVFRTSSVPLGKWAVFKLRPTDVMTTDGFVVPEFRGQRALTRMKSFGAEDYARRGYDRLLSRVKVNNKSSIRAQEHAGARRLFLMWGYRWRGLTVIWALGRLTIGRYGPQRRYVVDCSSTA